MYYPLWTRRSVLSCFYIYSLISANLIAKRWRTSLALSWFYKYRRFYLLTWCWRILSCRGDTIRLCPSHFAVQNEEKDWGRIGLTVEIHFLSCWHLLYCSFAYQLFLCFWCCICNLIVLSCRHVLVKRFNVGWSFVLSNTIRIMPFIPDRGSTVQSLFRMDICEFFLLNDEGLFQKEGYGSRANEYGFWAIMYSICSVSVPNC